MNSLKLKGWLRSKELWSILIFGSYHASERNELEVVLNERVRLSQ